MVTTMIKFWSDKKVDVGKYIYFHHPDSMYSAYLRQTMRALIDWETAYYDIERYFHPSVNRICGSKKFTVNVGTSSADQFKESISAVERDRYINSEVWNSAIESKLSISKEFWIDSMSEWVRDNMHKNLYGFKKRNGKVVWYGDPNRKHY